MISSVSNINFRGDAGTVNAQDLINSPGKFTTQPQAADVKSDSFEKEGEVKKKNKTGIIIGSIVGALAVAYITLSALVHKGTINRVPDTGDLKFKDKIQNFFYSIGESGSKLWKKIRGHADDVEGNKAPEGNKASEAGNAAETKPNEAAKPAEGGAKPEGEKHAEAAKPADEKPAEAPKTSEADAKPEGEKPAEGDKKPEGENK